VAEVGDLFDGVRSEHALEACRRVVRDGAPRKRGGRSTFVDFEGQRLPAKYVLGLAYQIATGHTLSPERYHGGDATAGILRRLGLRWLGWPLPPGQSLGDPAPLYGSRRRAFAAPVLERQATTQNAWISSTASLKESSLESGSRRRFSCPEGFSAAVGT